jgi:dTDP-4-amino-4,6-dideoxygalactose transaminase
MEASRRKEALSCGGLSIPWPSEPHLGGYYGEEEIEVVVKTMRESMNDYVHGFGFICEEIEQFEADFAKYCGAADAISITNAANGLDLAMMALDLQPGDEVICPSVNFRAAPMSIIGQGGTWVPCEVDPKTLQADPADVEKRMTPRTRAIYPVHMNGLSAPIDAYIEIAERHPHPKHGPAKVIGDAARALGGGYKGGKIGGFGWMTVFSFHTMKNMTTLGEGGAVTMDDPELAARARSIRQFGGGGGWGTNFKMTKVQAAVGIVQLKRLDDFIAARREVARKRTELLADIPELQLPYEPADCVHSYYLYSILVQKEWAGEKRDQLMAILRDEYGIDTCVANPPTHSTIPFLTEHTGGAHLPVSEEVGQRLFCPPIHPRMSDQDNEYICAALWETVEKLR